jgi:hypothetical protein
LGNFQNKIAVSFRFLKLFKELIIQDRFFHWFLKNLRAMVPGQIEFDKPLVKGPYSLPIGFYFYYEVYIL